MFAVFNKNRTNNLFGENRIQIEIFQNDQRQKKINWQKKNLTVLFSAKLDVYDLWHKLQDEIWIRYYLPKNSESKMRWSIAFFPISNNSIISYVKASQKLTMSAKYYTKMVKEDKHLIIRKKKKNRQRRGEAIWWTASDGLLKVWWVPNTHTKHTVW